MLRKNNDRICAACRQRRQYGLVHYEEGTRSISNFQKLRLRALGTDHELHRPAQARIWDQNEDPSPEHFAFLEIHRLKIADRAQ